MSGRTGKGDTGKGDPDPIARRLREFLATLPMDACARLMTALERAQLAGESLPGSELITSALTAVAAERRRKLPRLGNPQRYFFALLDPFVIEEDLPERQPARISRESLGHIWAWMQRDVAAEAVAAYEEAVTAALLAEDIDKAKALARDLGKALLPALRNAIPPSTDETALRRFMGNLGGPQVFDDLLDVLFVLTNEEALRLLSQRIVGPIRAVDEASSTFLAGSLQPFAKGTALLMPHACSILMSKLAQPAQIVRVARHALDTDDAGRIAASPFAAILDLLICDLERLLLRVQPARLERDSARLGATVADFVAIVRALVNDLRMPPELDRAKRIARHRSRMAQLLKPELETLPARVRHLLVARPAGGRPLEFDAREAANVAMGLELFQAAKIHASELALNEVTLRTASDLQTFLDFGIDPLLEGMRHAVPGEDRAYRLQQLESAVRIAGLILGPGYAALLSRAVEVAAAEKPRPVVARSA